MMKIFEIFDFKGCAVSPQPWQPFYQLPDIFRSNYLTELRVAACTIRSWMNLPTLRVIFLNDVCLRDEVMEEILCGCPILEDVSVVDCYGLRELNCKNPNLKKLMVSQTEWSKRMFVSCPHAVSLEICGMIELVTLRNVSSLVDASIYYDSYSFQCKQRTYDFIRRLLMKIHQCKTVTLCSRSILILSIWKLRNSPFPLFKWKNIKLKVGLTKWHFPGLSFLLKASRCLETLTMYMPRGWDSLFQIEDAKWIWEYDFDLHLGLAGGHLYLPQEHRATWSSESALCDKNCEVPAEKCSKITENGNFNQETFGSRCH